MILIVDDFQDGARAICMLLTKMGYPCEWKPSGPDALAFIRGHPVEMPLLVLLDHMMPDMTGIEVLREMRADPKFTQTPVIMFSAGFDLAARDEAITLGAAAWIMKGGSGAGGVDEIINLIIHWYEKVGGVKQDSSKRAE